MKGVTIDQVDAVVEGNCFKIESSSKSSWKFYNQTPLPRSEIVFFCAYVCYNTANITFYC